MILKKNIAKLKDLIEKINKYQIDLNNPLERKKGIIDFKERKKEYYYNEFKSTIKKIKESGSEISLLSINNDKEKITKLDLMIKNLEEKDIKKLEQDLLKIEEITDSLKIEEEKTSQIKVPSSLPSEIKAEIKEDYKELHKCFNAECYRSAIIICGRILEIALFRKYYDETGIDLLEKAPGTGLGNLIAKLKSKNVSLDPALTNQIHLINQIRVVSVHKKKEIFIPTKNQTHAIMLYTLDTLEKLF